MTSNMPSNSVKSYVVETEKDEARKKALEDFVDDKFGRAVSIMAPLGEPKWSGVFPLDEQQAATLKEWLEANGYELGSVDHLNRERFYHTG